ncbi:MAG: hypothetical protein ACOX75_00745 [Lachnospiraceae bacterium]|jgi:hypothetical protein
MENETRKSRVQKMNDMMDDIHPVRRSTPSRQDAPSRQGAPVRQDVPSRAGAEGELRHRRVAPDMRTGSSPRVQSVDASGFQSNPRGDSRSASELYAARSARTASNTGVRKVSLDASERDEGLSALRTPSGRSSSSSAAASSLAASRRSSASASKGVRSSAGSQTGRISADSRSARIFSDSQDAKTASLDTRTTSANRNYSDIMEERRGKSSSQKPVAKKKSSGRKRMSGFAKFIIAYSILLIAILAAGAVILRSFLKTYEAAQPKNIASAVVEKFQTPDELNKFLETNKNAVKVPENIFGFDGDYSRFIDGKQISYVEDTANSTNEAKTYRILADGATVASINLGKGGTGSFNLAKWKLASIDMTPCFAKTKSYSILVPGNSKVTVNGITLGEDSISGEGVPEVLKNSVNYMSNAPEFTTYNIVMVSGDDPKVTGTDKNGNELVFSATDTAYVAGGEASAAFIDEVGRIVEAAITEWGTYFIHMSFNLEPYILDGSDLHAYIFGSDEMDPILTWLYNFEYIEDYNFVYTEADNYTVYSDDCFTVDVKYDMEITFDRAGVEDNNQNLDATWVWVRDGNSWSICDMIYR